MRLDLFVKNRQVTQQALQHRTDIMAQPMHLSSLQWIFLFIRRRQHLSSPFIIHPTGSVSDPAAKTQSGSPAANKR
jgi:hypothetical protein